MINESISAKIKIEQIITVLVLLALSIVSFVPPDIFSSPAISSDDWSLIVAPYAFGELGLLNLFNHRPIDMSVYYFLSSLLGLHFVYYYLFNALILFFSAILMYMLTKRLFVQSSWLASLAAIAYLIYPVDYTRTWIIMLYIRFWWLISLGAAWLLLDFLDSGNKWKFVLAMIGIIIPLGAYEGQFGFIATAALLATLFAKDTPTQRRLALVISIFAISVSFYLWRFYIQAHLPDIRYYSVGSFQFNPTIIIQRYIAGFKIFFSGWLAPIQSQPGFPGFQIVFWLAVYLGFSYFASYVILQKSASASKFSCQQKLLILKSQLIMFLTGTTFWIAGYFPIIGLYAPTLSIHASRVNLFATAGAALALVSIAAITSTTVARSKFHFKILVSVLILPFLVAGVFVQQKVNEENKIAWQAQRDIWNGVFETIPNIQDEKSLVVIIPGYTQLRTFESYPFTTAWEIDAGAKVLYNKPNIGGYYLYSDLSNQQFKFKKNGIIPPGTGRLVGYKKLVFLLYDPQNHTTSLVENLEDTLSLPFSVNNYSPLESIIPEQPSTADFRWLVQ